MRFFKNIRLSKILGKKKLDYVKYALGEIILVTIGILLAVWINDINNERLNYKAEKDYLMSIKADLIIDKGELNTIYSYQQKRLDNAERLYNILNNDAFNSDTADLFFRELLLKRNPTFFPVIGAFNQSIIKSNSTKVNQAFSEIAKLYKGSYEKLVYNGELLDERNRFLQETMIRPIRNNSISKYSDNKQEYLDELYKFKWRLTYYVDLLKNNGGKIEKALEKIDFAIEE
ncbi:MAG: hypothetical protein H6608_05980 [Flavobacteriales bacterium]|nr:hypothetical protein [Flavobacteriales bacterium]